MNTATQFRAVYVPQVPMHALTVEAPTLEKAVYALESVIALSIFEYENRVKPDYSDFACIEHWNGVDWEFVDDEEWGHIFESAGFVIGSTKEES